LGRLHDDALFCKIPFGNGIQPGTLGRKPCPPGAINPFPHGILDCSAATCVNLRIHKLIDLFKQSLIHRYRNLRASHDATSGMTINHTDNFVIRDRIYRNS